MPENTTTTTTKKTKTPPMVIKMLAAWIWANQTRPELSAVQRRTLAERRQLWNLFQATLRFRCQKIGLKYSRKLYYESMREAQLSPGLVRDAALFLNNWFEENKPAGFRPIIIEDPNGQTEKTTG